MNLLRLAQPPPLRQSIVLCALLAAALAVVSCGGGKKAAQAPAITPWEALARSKAAMAAAQSFKFELAHPTGATQLPGGLFLTRADGAVVAPDRLSVNAEANFGRVFIKVQAVVIGRDTYMTNFLTGAWSAIPPEDSPFAFLDPIGLVASLVGEVTGPAFPEPLKAGGDLVIKGRISAKPLAALVGSVDESKTVDVRLTLDPASYLLKEVLVEGAVQPGEGQNAARLIKLSGFGEPISIERPV